MMMMMGRWRSCQWRRPSPFSVNKSRAQLLPSIHTTCTWHFAANFRADIHNSNRRGGGGVRALTGFPQFFQQVSLQTTHVLRIHCMPSMTIHGWSEVKTMDIRQKWWRHLWTAPCCHHLFKNSLALADRPTKPQRTHSSTLSISIWLIRVLNRH